MKDLSHMKREQKAEEGEPPLSDLVHSTKVLNEVVVPYSTVLHFCRSQGDAVTQSLVGCLTACKMLTSGTVIVDQIEWVNRDTIGFKHSPMYSHPTTLLSGTKITDQIFREWVDQLVLRDEPLPLFVPLRDRKMNVVNRQLMITAENRQYKKGRLAEKRMDRNAAFKCTFGEDIAKVLINPRQLLQLLQLGPAEFERVVVGLYVVHKRPWSLERIERVTWDAVPTYKVNGHGPLNVVLCFKEFSCILLKIDQSRPSSNHLGPYSRDHQKTIGQACGVRQGTVSKIIESVTNALSEVAPFYVQLPEPDQLNAIKAGFYGKANMPRVIGCVDGTFLPLQRPANELDYGYVCRKGFTALNCMAVAKFVAPSAEHIKRKAQELEEALRKTQQMKRTAEDLAGPMHNTKRIKDNEQYDEEEEEDDE
ncbi:hypothetical protein niasHS_002825 [Heterodera schachtii]|uniref:Uncharacterized protein n=1 Tax=Heterodera schachtii TaxID=97005 RepID=A0ABD2K2K5_HETSC